MDLHKQEALIVVEAIMIESSVYFVKTNTQVSVGRNELEWYSIVLGDHVLGLGPA